MFVNKEQSQDMLNHKIREGGLPIRLMERWRIKHLVLFFFFVWFLVFISFCLVTSRASWVTSFLVHSFSFVDMPHSNKLRKEPLLIVVLTGDEGRVEKGLQMLKNNPSSFLFISGVNKGISMDNFLSIYHVDMKSLKRRIEIGYVAHNTQQNATETAEWLVNSMIVSKRQNIALVTSSYHMIRSILEFHHVLNHRNITPIVVVSNISRDHFLGQFWRFLRFNFWEYSKIILMPFRWKY